MPSAHEEFPVAEAEAGKTLAAALRGWLPGKSWNEIRRLVSGRRVLVGGTLCLDDARRLGAGEVVTLLGDATKRPPSAGDVVIRHLDEHVVVVEKPAGMTTQRRSEERGWSAQKRDVQPTLDEVLPPLVAKRSRGPWAKSGWRPLWAVHRLDRDTSGLMVFALSHPAEQHLLQQFRRHTIDRAYLALVIGAAEDATYSSRLVRDRGDGRRGSTALPTVGKHAVTHVELVESLGDYSLMECRLETGRTHQIRIHLAEAGFPVCGDKVYIQPLRGEKIADRSKARRQMLHAYRLGFVHPITGKILSFESPLPADMQQVLAKLRESKRK